MNIAIIENGICTNVMVCESLELAQELFPEATVVLPESGYWMGDLYEDGVWSHPVVEDSETTEDSDVISE